MTQFVNAAKPCDPRDHCPWFKDDSDVSHFYGFDKTPDLLYPWSRAIQVIISQAGTKLLTGKFHDGECGIYKCEGGCKIHGVNELVVYHDCCRWDFGKSFDKNLGKMAKLITAIVLGFDPMDPVNSMLTAASKFLNESDVETTPEEIKEAGFNARSGGPFGGDSLSSFFNHNPFSDWKHDRDYLRYCYTKFENMTDADVDQKFADEDLGKELLAALNKKFREKDQYEHVLCCLPRRTDQGLGFWLNNGRKLYGWYTREQIEKIIETGEYTKRE